MEYWQEHTDQNLGSQSKYSKMSSNADHQWNNSLSQQARGQAEVLAVPGQVQVWV
jgi:hypothetical protein